MGIVFSGMFGAGLILYIAVNLRCISTTFCLAICWVLTGWTFCKAVSSRDDCAGDWPEVARFSAVLL